MVELPEMAGKVSGGWIRIGGKIAQMENNIN